MLRTLPLSLFLFAGLAHADEAEWRVGAGGGGAVVNVRAGGTDGTGIGYQAHGRVGYGLSNTFELGFVGMYASVSNVPFDGAALAGQTGRLFADVSTAELLAEVRWRPGVALAGAFERTSPFLAARTGVALVMRTSQELLAPGNLLLVAPQDEIELAAVAGGAFGVEHRFGDHLFVSAELGAERLGDATLIDVTAEAAWAFF
jgi:hypothetical protein